MAKPGPILVQNKVRRVFLIHGTFAGNDALGLFDMIEPALRKLTNSAAITNRLKNHGKQLLNSLAKDLGNYTPEYIDTFNQALERYVICELFTWGSGNFHLARLKGAIELSKALANTIKEQNILTDERLLLIGHSHAGQLFALITLFLENGEKAGQLYDIVDKHESLDKEDLIKDIEALEAIYLDIVTFGTPVRYPWGKYKKFRLIAVVNHRSSVTVSGLLTTRDGDYVQQWGVEGTDITPPDNVKLNDELDSVLDKGRDREALIKQLKIPDRQSPKYNDGTIVTESVLIDYKDNDEFSNFLSAPALIPNCVNTLFGHGVYTKHKTMRFNIDLITNKLYRSSD